MFFANKPFVVELFKPLMKINILFNRTGIIVIAILSSVACHKESSNYKPITPTTATDTLTQSVYTINSGGSSAPAMILASPFVSSVSPSQASPGLLLIMDQDGKVLQKKTTDGSAFNLNRWIINGQTRYTYFVNDVNAYRAPGLANNNTGYVVIADSNLQEIKRVNFIPNGAGPFQPGQALDAHDFILLSDDHYISMAYYAKHVDNIPAYLNPSATVQVEVPVIQEVSNGVVTWQWDASSDTSFYANSVEGNNYADSVNPQDYMHMNGMYIDPKDNGLICSFRTQDQIIKLNRQTGAVVWRLGGKNSDFALFSDQQFLRQHNPTLTDSNSTLLLFDDGEINLRAESRILEFKLDELNKKVTGFKSYTIPEPFSQFMGSVQKMGDEYFIGGGTANYMLEVNYTTGQKVKEFLGTEPTYRAYRYPTGTRAN
jgi:arylsulfate sulfotransferase